MKKLLFIFSFILSLSSCTQQEEVCYSCDSEIDAWVKTNKTELSEMNREELSNLDRAHQRAALKSFTPKRKKQLWTEKLNQVLKATSLTEEEQKYLQYAVKTLNNNDFKSGFSESKTKEIFDWIVIGQEQFGWSDEYVYNSFFTYSKKVYYLSDSPDGKGNPEQLDCSCRSHWACFSTGRGCSDNDCKTTSDGCGFFGDMACIGLCG